MILSQAISRIAASRTTAITDRAFELRAAGQDVISLSVGEPDFATPPHVIAAAKAALDAGETRYTAVPGTAALRQAGHIRRFGVIVRHRELGYCANAMTVWDVADDNVAAIGQRIAAMPDVTLCYRRPRRLPLVAMRRPDRWVSRRERHRRRDPVIERFKKQ